MGQGPLAELAAFLRSWCADLRTRRDFAGLNDGQAAAAIVADLALEHTAASRHAYAAQQADLEAARLVAAAQHPASPGGRTITPAEARPILRNIHHSASHDAQATQILL